MKILDLKAAAELLHIHPVTLRYKARTLARLYSSLTTLMALRGWFLLKEVWAELPGLIEGYLLDCCMFEGAHPDKYIEEQVRLRGKRFNLFMNSQGDDGPDQIPNEYRQKSRGGK